MFCHPNTGGPVLCISGLRRDTNYLLFYINLLRIPVTGLIPLVSLCVLNYLVYKRLVRRRRKMRNSIGRWISCLL